MGKADKLKELVKEAEDLEAKLRIFYEFLDGTVAVSNDVDDVVCQMEFALPYLNERIKAAGSLADKLNSLSKRQEGGNV